MSRFEEIVIKGATSGLLADVIATDGHNGLVAIAPGHVSTDNSTVATLGGGASFTGDWEDITNFGVIVISVTSDVASATDGLMVQFSSDGTVGGIISDDDYTIAAGAKKTFSFQAASQFYRVVYTNGVTIQGSFNLQTVMKPYYVKPSSHRIQDSIVDDDDAELIKAVMTGRNPSGDFVNFQATSAGNFKVSVEEIQNKLSTDNSTTATLAGGVVYTGTGEDVSNFANVTIQLDSSHDSAVDGMTFQFSIDDTNWDDVYTFTYTASEGARRFQFPVTAQYFRLVYTNGATLQTHFRVQTILHVSDILTSIHRLKDDVSPDRSLEIVKSVLMSRSDIVGDFKVVDVAHPLPVRDATLNVSRGLEEGVTHINKFGRAEAGIQTTLTDIWDRADAAATQQIWVAPTQARLHDITSSSTADDGTPEGAGAGAQAVRVFGLTDWDTNEVNEDVILNGTGDVTTSNSYVIIHRMIIIPVGTTYETNVGIITATAQTDNSVTAQINIGNGQTEMAIFGIPSTQIAYMTGFDVNAHNTGNPSTVMENDFDLVVNENPNINLSVFIKKANVGMIVTGSSAFPKAFNPYLKIAGPAIIKFQAISTLADTEGVAEYDIILVDN